MDGWDRPGSVSRVWWTAEGPGSRTARMSGRRAARRSERCSGWGGCDGGSRLRVRYACAGATLA
jgi:hypothetical protein